MDFKVLGLTWSPRMTRMEDEKKAEMQAFIDKTVIKEMEPFVPKRSGALSKSVVSGSVIGSGLLTFAIIYANKQYNLPNRKYVVGKRDSFWFDRMKKARMANINRNVKAKARRLDKSG